MNIQEKERIGMYYWLGIAFVLAIVVIFISKIGVKRRSSDVVLPTAYPAETVATPAVNWDEKRTTRTWKENGDEYKVIGYVHRSGLDGIYKNGEKIVDANDLPVSGEVQSLWMSEENNVIFGVENSTEQFSDGSIDFSNRIIKITLPNYQKYTVWKEPVPAMHGGLSVHRFYPESKQLLVTFGSGGACSLRSEIWLIDVEKMIKKVVKITEFSMCGDGKDGGTQNLGFNSESFVFFNRTIGNIEKLKLSLYNPVTNKEEVILTGAEIPGTEVKMDRDRNTEVIFTNESGEEFRFDTETRVFVKD